MQEGAFAGNFVLARRLHPTGRRLPHCARQGKAEQFFDNWRNGPCRDGPCRATLCQTMKERAKWP